MNNLTSFMLRPVKRFASTIYNRFVSHNVHRNKSINPLGYILLSVCICMMITNVLPIPDRLGVFLLKSVSGLELDAIVFADDVESSNSASVDESQPFLHYQQGLKYMDDAEFDQAIAAFEQALRYNENPLDSHFKLGSLYHFVKNDPVKSRYHMEKYMELLAAINNADELAKLNDTQEQDETYKKAALLFQQALVDANNGDLISARQNLENAVQTYPYDPVMFYNLGIVNHKLNKLDAAIDNYKKAVSIDSSYEAAFYGMGIANQQKGDNLAAIDMYKKVLQLNPQNVAVLNNTAILLEQVGMYDDAIERYQQIIAIDPLYVRSYNNLGTIFARRNEMDTAISYFMDAIEHDPTYIEPHYNLGKIYEDQGNTQKALEEYRLVFLHDSDFPGIEDKISKLEQVYPDKQVLMGDAAESQNTPDLPVVVVHKNDSVVKEQPAEQSEDTETTLRRKRINELTSEVTANPDSVDAQIALIDYLVSIDKLEDAFQYAEQAHEQFGDNAQVHMRLADIATKRNFFYRATKEYEAILVQHPDQIDVHYRLSLIYVDKRNPLRDSKTALMHYNKFMDAGGVVPDENE